MNRFSLGVFKPTESMERRVLEVLHSGRLSYGPASKEFEKKFAEAQGMDYACLSNSGTSSLVVSLQALKELHGWADGDEVLVPAMTFVATVNAVLHNRLTPVLVDVDERHYDINVDLVERAITPRTRAILPVSLFGWPCDMVAVRDIARTHNLRVLADNCETTFGRVEDLSTDAWADISCHSLYVAHTLTCGVGGVSTTDNPDYALKIRSLANHGLDLSELPTGEHFETSWLGRHFRFTSVGHSFRITELEAAIALEQLQDWKQLVHKRQRVAAWIESVLGRFHEHLQLPAKREKTTPCPMVYPLVCRREAKYNLMKHLRANGVECRDMVPLLNQPCYRGIWKPSDFPVALSLETKGLYIGCHQELNHDNVTFLESVFAEYFKGR